MKRTTAQATVGILLVIGSAALLTGCEVSRNNTSWETDGFVLSAANSKTRDAHGGTGIGPVREIDMESLSADRAQEGAALFVRRCSACHRMDEKLIGPALKGVTERREPEWILNWVLNTDIMAQRDPDALELLGSFLTQMTNQKLDVHDAESILVFFREYDRGNVENPVKAIPRAVAGISTEVPVATDAAPADATPPAQTH